MEYNQLNEGLLRSFCIFVATKYSDEFYVKVSEILRCLGFETLSGLECHCTLTK